MHAPAASPQMASSASRRMCADVGGGRPGLLLHLSSSRNPFCDSHEKALEWRPGREGPRGGRQCEAQRPSPPESLSSLAASGLHSYQAAGTASRAGLMGVFPLDRSECQFLHPLPPHRPVTRAWAAGQRGNTGVLAGLCRQDPPGVLRAQQWCCVWGEAMASRQAARRMCKAGGPAPSDAGAHPACSPAARPPTTHPQPSAAPRRLEPQGGCCSFKVRPWAGGGGECSWSSSFPPVASK